MSTIIIKHIIEESKFTINFDIQDGSLSFPSRELNIEGDIDLSAIISKLSEFIEQKKELHIEFEDTSNLAESNPKIKLIKETLNEIYNKFNEQFTVKTEVDTQEESSEVAQSEKDDDLPF